MNKYLQEESLFYGKLALGALVACIALGLLAALAGLLGSEEWALRFGFPAIVALILFVLFTWASP
jgi:hypothetical protein